MRFFLSNIHTFHRKKIRKKKKKKIFFVGSESTIPGSANANPLKMKWIRNTRSHRCLHFPIIFLTWFLMLQPRAGTSKSCTDISDEPRSSAWCIGWSKRYLENSINKPENKKKKLMGKQTDFFGSKQTPPPPPHTPR